MNKMVFKNGVELEILSFTEDVSFEGSRKDCVQVFLPTSDDFALQIDEQRKLLTSSNISSIHFEVDGQLFEFNFSHLVVFIYRMNDDMRTNEIILKRSL